MKNGFMLLALGFALLLGGCNAKTLQNESPDEAEVKTFDAPFDRLVEAARLGLLELKLVIQSEADEPAGYVINFTRRASMSQYGAVGRLMVDKDPPHTVRINYQRRFLGFSGPERVSRNIFAKMDLELKRQPR